MLELEFSSDLYSAWSLTDDRAATRQRIIIETDIRAASRTRLRTRESKRLRKLAIDINETR